MPFLTSLFRRHIKGFSVGVVIAFFPKAFGWIAEQWFGNRVGEAVDKMLCLIAFDVFKAPFLWMAGHPIQSVVYMTCALVGLFSIETKIHERSQRENNPTRQPEDQSAAERALASAKQAVADAMPPKLGTIAKTTGLAETLRDQFLTQGEGSHFKIEASQVHGGIIVRMSQLLDRNKAFRCNVVLVDLKKIEDGEPCATAELHKPDGSFKYGRVFLDLGAADNNLYYNSPGSWWLVSKSGPQIRYYWGERRERGSIDVRAGDWAASIEIEVADLVFKREIKYSWSGSDDLKLVTS